QGIPGELVHPRALVARWPRLLAELFRRRREPAAVGLAQEGLDPLRRSARLVPMVLPLLYGPADTAGGRPPDQALARNPSPHRANQAQLRAGRPDVPPAATSGASALGLRQPQDLTPAPTVRLTADSSRSLAHFPQTISGRPAHGTERGVAAARETPRSRATSR